MFEKGKILLSLLVALFAIGSWIDLNGVWVELPLLVNRLPEGWNLPTYVIMFVQLANIAPILYLAFFRKSKTNTSERYTIYIILLLGSICCALLSIFWKHTLYINIFGNFKETSVAFFTLICILSIVDTTSSVTFLPYMINYPRQFLTALYVGEGLSGFIPGIAGIIQGVGGEPICSNVTLVINGTNHNSYTPIFPSPRFSVDTFFKILCVILLMCLISFTFMDQLPLFKKYQLKSFINNMEVSKVEIKENGNDVSLLKKVNVTRSKHIQYSYILIIGYINFLTNGVLPSIQNYTLMPYSNTLYHIVVTVSQIINPIACLLTLRKWNIQPRHLISMTVIASVCSAYLLFLASMSPSQFLGSNIGPVLAAASWFIVGSLFSFEKTVLAIELQQSGHYWLQLCGISTQLGSALGAISIFILVAVIKVFQSKTVC